MPLRLRATLLTLGIALTAFAAITGCAALWAGAGAAGAATAYEAHNKRELDQLNNELESGRMSTDEYGTRRDEVEDRSLVY